MSRTFITTSGVELPVAEEHLFAALSPTTPGTNYWEAPPPSALTDRQRARILLQSHQLIDVFRMAGSDLAGKRLLDVGTGNGFVPRLVLDLTDLAEAVGSDPFLDGEHQTSWQSHDHDVELRAMRKLIDDSFGKRLDIERYAAVLGHENFSMRPAPVDLATRRPKPYSFHQVGAHNLDVMDAGKFDFAYCKAIEHIPDWPGVFHSVNEVLADDGLFYLKHRSFFSYLGAHRYGSTFVPWGHVLLTDDDYRRYATTIHPERSEKMQTFFFEDLSYPRHSVSDMVEFASANGLEPVLILTEPPRYLSKAIAFSAAIEDFWALVHQNYPRVGADEILSGMHHIVFKKRRVSDPTEEGIK